MTETDIIGMTAPSRAIALLLVEDFALMSYASVIEPFRAANMLAGMPLYRWSHVSIDGQPVNASNGATILADARAGDPVDCDILFVFAAGNPSAFDDRRTFAWLRRLAASGVSLAGVSGGPYLLARAGLLDGHRATIHWEHAAALAEEFPALVLESGLYVIDDRRMTCAGGVAGLDLAIELIARDHGAELAGRVGEWFIRSAARPAEGAQRRDARERYGVDDPRLLRALAAMEASVEVPLGRSALARIAGVSPRQLERLFRTQLAVGIAATYLRIRLDHAAWLLRSTRLPVTAVAVASGFASPAHFARRYRARFGHPPSQNRAGQAAAVSDSLARPIRPSVTSA